MNLKKNMRNIFVHTILAATISKSDVPVFQSVVEMIVVLE